MPTLILTPLTPGSLSPIAASEGSLTAAAAATQGSLSLAALTRGSLNLAILPFIDVHAQFGAKGDGIADDTAAIQAAINAADGKIVWFPPGTYLVTAPLTVTTHCKLLGFWSKLKGGANTKYGSILTTTAAAQAAFTNGLLALNNTYLEVEGLALVGAGYANGKSGFYADTNSHGLVLRRVYAEGFDSGLGLGSGSNHATVHDSYFTNNNHGVELQHGNLFDYEIHNCDLTGNATSSLHLVDLTSTENVALYRTHLGFSPYGVLQEGTTGGYTFGGLTLMDSPIEGVSVQHIRLNACGNVNVKGGYWTWNGTPANPAFECESVSYGPVDLDPRLEPTSPNANSPAVIRINGFTNFVVTARSALNAFAATTYGTHANDKRFVALTYSTSITPTVYDPTTDTINTINVTNGTAFTINAPSAPTSGTRMTIHIRNASGGAMGVITWNTAYALEGGAWTNPADGANRLIRFYFNSGLGKWIELGRSAADITA